MRYHVAGLQARAAVRVLDKKLRAENESPLFPLDPEAPHGTSEALKSGESHVSFSVARQLSAKRCKHTVQSDTYQGQVHSHYLNPRCHRRKTDRAGVLFAKGVSDCTVCLHRFSACLADNDFGTFGAFEDPASSICRWGSGRVEPVKEAVQSATHFEE